MLAAFNNKSNEKIEEQKKNMYFKAHKFSIHDDDNESWKNESVMFTFLLENSDIMFLTFSCYMFVYIKLGKRITYSQEYKIIFSFIAIFC